MTLFQLRASLALICAIIAFIPGCARKPVTMKFPLTEETSWTYSGSYATKAAGKTIALPVYNHNICVEKESEVINSITYKKLNVTREGNPFHTFLLRADESGLLCWNGKEAEILLPASLHPGDTWNVTIFGRELIMKMEKCEEVKVPAGVYNSLRISFREREKERIRGSIWCADGVGIVALEIEEVEERPPHNLRLELNELCIEKGEEKN